MRTFHPLPLLGLAAALLLIFAAGPASAQSARPSLPSGPQGGSFSSSGDLRITSSANEHGNALWVVDSVQHTVTLCEKVDTAKDFACTKKPLP